MSNPLFVTFFVSVPLECRRESKAYQKESKLCLKPNLLIHNSPVTIEE
jgi:hypothetical protein